MTELTPIRREILVPADPSVAFRVFTERIGTWWPLADLSVYGAVSSVAFVDDVLVETAPDEPDSVWGRVTRWAPPSVVAFSWHPGRDPERASHVQVTFEDANGHTLVRLEHSGWENFADPAVARTEYDKGWPAVLGRYRDAVGPVDDETGSLAAAAR